MARDKRQKLIADLKKERGDNVVVSYITFTRGNFGDIVKSRVWEVGASLVKNS